MLEHQVGFETAELVSFLLGKLSKERQKMEFLDVIRHADSRAILVNFQDLAKWPKVDLPKVQDSTERTGKMGG